MNNSCPFLSFQSHVLRVPLLPLNTFRDLTSEKVIEDDSIKKLFKNPIIREAIYLASPELFREADKWCLGAYQDEKLKFSLLKYITRMSSRCTPFGLFAGCSVGEISENTEIILNSPTENKRYTRLDMNYLVALSQNLVEVKNIKNQIYFYPNTSCYEVGDKLRYIEYQYLNKRRHHFVSSVDYSIYLEQILEHCKNGAYIKDLINLLVKQGIDIDDSTQYIDQLVENQIIVSELEPAVMGPEYLDQIIGVLEKVDNTAKILGVINNIKLKLTELDNKLGNKVNLYRELHAIINELGTSSDPKYLFQTDLKVNCLKNKLSDKTVEVVKRGLAILNLITPRIKDSNLLQFKNSFYERYEEREINLTHALDPEIGVSYLQNNEIGDSNPLVDDLVLPQKSINEEKLEIEIDSFQGLLYNKLLESHKLNLKIISISNEDIEKFTQSWQDLPDTIFAVLELVKINGQELIKLNGASGSSAANLLARFGHGNSDLQRLVEQIVKKEEDLNEGKILAEIGHLPESRVGNILVRPSTRKFEIPYLAKSFKSDNFCISLQDLKLSVSAKSEIKLRSTRLKTEIVPKLTNAHNYHQNSLPIYHFLADLQNQGKQNDINISIGNLYDKLDHIPRIQYENLILLEATWNIKKSEIQNILNVFDDDELFENELEVFLNIREIPSEVKLVDGDNHLLVNFKNLTSAKLLFETIKNRLYFKLIESLLDEDSVVSNEFGGYANQIILPLYKKSS